MDENLELPSERELIANLRRLAQKEEAIRLVLEAHDSGMFHHPDGRTDDLKFVRLQPGEAGLLAWLAERCPTPLSIEIGFGMGNSAAIILGTRRLAGKPFAHLIYDPFGLPGGRGKVVQSYLEGRFPKAFRRIMKPSEIGLAQLLEKHGRGTAGLIFIDGGHQFDNVIVDFILADKLLAQGGYIVFDDAWFPAIETAINYVKSNRPDYAVAHLAVPNTTIIRKVAEDKRPWDAFTPFEVPQRQDWTATASAGIKAPPRDLVD